MNGNVNSSSHCRNVDLLRVVTNVSDGINLLGLLKGVHQVIQGAQCQIRKWRLTPLKLLVIPLKERKKEIFPMENCKHTQ